MVKIYGYSDDNVVIEGSDYFENEIACYEEKVTIWFDDDTKIQVAYGKYDKAIWGITVLEEGKAENMLTPCEDEDAVVYSDIFEIDAEVVNHCVGDVIEDVQELKKQFREMQKEYPVSYIEQAYEEVFGRDL